MTEPELEALMRDTYRPLFAWCARRVGSADAEDILQDVYWRAWRKLHLEPGRSPKPWLYTVAARRVNSLLAKRFARAEEELPDEAQGALADAPCFLDEALQALPPKRRGVVILRGIIGLEDAEIAKRMGISETTVRRHASMGFADLRAAL